MENNVNMDKIHRVLEEMKTYEHKIFEFDHEENDFRPNANPNENGLYLTIRCGLGGIYTMLNDWEDDHWGTQVLDGSKTIAYCPKKIELESLKD